MINREVLAEGLIATMNEQYKDILKRVESTLEDELNYDSVVTTLIDIKYTYPLVEGIIEDALTKYKTDIIDEKTSQYKTYLNCREEQKIKGQLELYTDEFLQQHTLEELASVLRP